MREQPTYVNLSTYPFIHIYPITYIHLLVRAIAAHFPPPLLGFIVTGSPSSPSCLLHSSSSPLLGFITVFRPCLAALGSGRAGQHPVRSSVSYWHCIFNSIQVQVFSLPRTKSSSCSAAALTLSSLPAWSPSPLVAHQPRSCRGSEVSWARPISAAFFLGQWRSGHYSPTVAPFSWYFFLISTSSSWVGGG